MGDEGEISERSNLEDYFRFHPVSLVLVFPYTFCFQVGKDLTVKEAP